MGWVGADEALQRVSVRHVACRRVHVLSGFQRGILRANGRGRSDLGGRLVGRQRALALWAELVNEVGLVQNTKQRGRGGLTSSAGGPLSATLQDLFFEETAALGVFLVALLGELADVGEEAVGAIWTGGLSWSWSWRCSGRWGRGARHVLGGRGVGGAEARGGRLSPCSGWRGVRGKARQTVAAVVWLDGCRFSTVQTWRQ
ncbi:hypothetical protein BC567DRAFT_61659 [Phyllosticta citribraziliensis]